MKNNATLLIILSLLGYFPAAAQAPSNSLAPESTYYWVVETHPDSTQSTPALTTVFRIYHDTDQLVYEETIPNAQYDIRKRSTRRQLDKALYAYTQSVARLHEKNLLSTLAHRAPSRR